MNDSMGDTLMVTTIAGGDRQCYYGSDDIYRKFGNTIAIGVDKNDHVYTIDGIDKTIRMIHNKVVSCIVTSHPYMEKSIFNHVLGLCVSMEDIIYVSDVSPHGIYRICGDSCHPNVEVVCDHWKRNEGGLVSDAPSLPHCNAICIAQDGRIYASHTNDHSISMIYDGEFSRIAGNRRQGFRDGEATYAMFDQPTGLCVSIDHKIYVADTFNHRIRMIDDDQVTTIGGNGQQGFQDGHVRDSKFNHPSGVCVSINGTIYVTDTYNHRIRMIAGHQITTIAGQAGRGCQDGLSNVAMFHAPSAMCMNRNDDLYIVDKLNYLIRRINTSVLHEKYVGKNTLLFSFNNIFQTPSLLNYRLTLNHHVFHVNKKFITARCQYLFDADSQSLLEHVKVDLKAFDMFISYLHTNKIYPSCMDPLIMENNIEFDMDVWIDFLFVMDVFSMVTSTLKIALQQSLHQIFNLSEEMIIPTSIHVLSKLYSMYQVFQVKFNPSTTRYSRGSNISHGYRILLNLLKRTKNVISIDHLDMLNLNLSADDVKNVMQDLLCDEAIDNNGDGDGDNSDGDGDNDNDNNDNVNKQQLHSLLDLFTMAFKHTSFAYTIQSLPSPPTHVISWCQPDFIIRLIHDDKNYHVHKFVLCGRWRYFTLLLNAGLKESKDDQMILTDDWNDSRLEKWMNFIYLDKIMFHEDEDVKWILKNARLYTIAQYKTSNPSLPPTTVSSSTNTSSSPLSLSSSDPQDEPLYEMIACDGFQSLYQHCMHLLKLNDRLTVDNIMDKYILVKELGLKYYIHRVMKFIVNHFDQLMKQPLTRQAFKKNIHDKTMMKYLYKKYES